MVRRAPKHFRVRMYNVGFGDCFLLSFTYRTPLPAPNGNTAATRHVLIDLGSTRRARSRLTMKRVAEFVEADCGGRLDAVVMSHRHKDHLSGFGTAQTTPVIAGLTPGLVVRPWTENPELAADAGQPAGPAIAGGAEPGSEGALLDALRRGEAAIDQIVKQSAKLRLGGQTDLVQLSEDELPNEDAVTELDRLAEDGRGEYLSAGMDTRLSDLLPGVQVRVIGPPLPSEWPPVSRQAEENDEYWLAARQQTRRLFRSAGGEEKTPLGTARWIIDALHADDQRQLMTLVRWLDDALNNTSLILTFATGGHTMLFGGDAQIENWSWALEGPMSAGVRELLEGVDLYKVGHHGSRNGTPISLFKMWAGTHQFVSMMSTREGVHGHSEAGAVPKCNLVTALRERGELLSTDGQALRECGFPSPTAGDADWVDVQAGLPGGAYEVVRGPIR